MKVKQAVTDLLRKNSQTKFKMILKCTMERTDMQSGEVTTNQSAFHSVNKLNLAATDLDELYNKMTGKIFEAIANYNKHGSNWVFRRVDSLEIHMVEFAPLRGKLIHTLVVMYGTMGHSS